MNNTKLVSILIATYNAEKFIKKTVQSCINQTYSEIEILIRDDNSTDNTVAVVKSIENEKVKLFKGEKNIGPYNGLNFLLEKAKGEYVAIQDHDDLWFPEKISKQIKFMENSPDFIACGTYVYYFFEDKETLFLKKFPEENNYVNHTSLLFRNDGFRYNAKAVLPDAHFERQVLLKKGRIGCVSEGLTIHRIRSDKKNLSRQRFQFSDIGKFFESMDGVNRNTIKFLFYLIFRRMVPDKITWFIRKHITMGRWDKIKKQNLPIIIERLL